MKMVRAEGAIGWISRQIEAAYAAGSPHTLLSQGYCWEFHCLYFEAKLQLSGAQAAFFLKIFIPRGTLSAPLALLSCASKMG